MTRVALALLLLPPLGAEVIDCIAVTVGRGVITRSAIDEQARITAFLNRDPIDLSASNLHRTAERLIDVALIRREMEISRYTPSADADVEKTLSKLRGAGDFSRALAGYGIDEPALKRYLILQDQTLAFVEVRFRPGTSVSDGDVELYYRENFVPEFIRQNPGKTPPELDEARDRIETALLDQRIDQAMEQWLKEARAQTRVVYLTGCKLGQSSAPATSEVRR